MTRKKWNRLKRQRPELEIGRWNPAASFLTNGVLKSVAQMSKRDVIEHFATVRMEQALTEEFLRNGKRGWVYLDQAYPNSDVTVKKVVDLKDAQA